jgi:2-polyprenyl-6-hydroxyphenyl methylase/3-demethylubiquinone-9 3-methyltransferase
MIRSEKKFKNVDQAEIDKFDFLAEQWWDPDGQLKSLHDINPLRLQYIMDRVELQGRKVLDAGCGAGLLSEAMTKMGAVVTGIDAGHAPIAAAMLHAMHSGLKVEYRHSTIDDLFSEESAGYDTIICFELLEHVPKPWSLVKICSQLVHDDGDVFFATLNRNFKSFIYAILGAEYVLRLLPIGTHQFSKFIKPIELKEWAEKSGMRLEEFTGMHYNPFTRKYSLGGNIHVNYFGHFRKN